MYSHESLLPKLINCRTVTICGCDGSVEYCYYIVQYLDNPPLAQWDRVDNFKVVGAGFEASVAVHLIGYLGQRSHSHGVVWLLEFSLFSLKPVHAIPAECGIGKLGIAQRSTLALPARFPCLEQLAQSLIRAPCYTELMIFTLYELLKHM